MPNTCDPPSLPIACGKSLGSHRGVCHPPQQWRIHEIDPRLGSEHPLGLVQLPASSAEGVGRSQFLTPSDYYYAFHGVPGSPFFFRLMSPRNVIGGFGYVASFSRLPEYMAWEWFGEGNGAESFARMKPRPMRSAFRMLYRGGRARNRSDVILADVVFFSEDLWILQPADWGGKTSGISDMT